MTILVATNQQRKETIKYERLLPHTWIGIEPSSGVLLSSKFPLKDVSENERKAKAHFYYPGKVGIAAGQQSLTYHCTVVPPERMEERLHLKFRTVLHSDAISGHGDNLLYFYYTEYDV